jgi:hypothetical protein
MTNPFQQFANASATSPATAPAQQFPAQQPQFQAPSNGNGFGAATAFADPPSTNPAPAPAAGGDPFSDPMPSSQIKFKDLLGRLVICKPLEIIAEITAEGIKDPAKDVVRCNIAVLDGDKPGAVFANMLVFQTAPKRDLGDIFRDPAKSLLIGRIAIGEKKGNKSAPYYFTKATDAERTLGVQFLGSSMAQNF